MNKNTKNALGILAALIIIIGAGLYYLTLPETNSLDSENKTPKSAIKIAKPSESSHKPATKRVDIFIQPLGDFPDQYTQEVAELLKGIYSGKVIINTPRPLPANALNKIKTRYRADSLLVYLNEQTGEGSLTIGLTSKDISHTKRNEAGDIMKDDWGIMGLGYQPGKSCVASTHRLKGSNQREKLFKLAIHELGHTQGLEHCPIKGCLMMDAKGRDHFDELEGFCAKCKAVLIGAGWNLN